MNDWIEVGGTDDIDEDDLLRWDHDGRTFVICNTQRGFFALDGLCTHEEQHLEDGLVIDNIVECPLHQGRFDIATGRALGPPVCVDLKTYPVRVEGGRIFIRI